jgi:hypothetical protein
VTFGTASLRICNCFPMRSLPIMDSPVIFRPGRERLTTNPVATGSVVTAMTMGVVPVACFAA